MSKDILIKKVKMTCPLCDKEHEVEERKREATITIKGKKISYEEIYYFCENSEEEENEFVPGKINDKNLLNARNAYRKDMGLLTSDEIAEIRKNYGLSQSDFSNLLGWGEVTVTRYESKSIQDEAYDNMMRIVRDNPMEAYHFLKKNKDRFTEEKYSVIKKRIVENINSYGKEYLKRQSLESTYIMYQEPCEENGFQQLDIDKIESMISYFAKQIPGLYKVLLMKLLWYADAQSYKQYGRAITGLVYRHQGMGALPIGHYKLLDLENVIVVEEEGHETNSVMYHIMPNKKLDMKRFSQQEMDVINGIVKKFKNYTGTKIAEYMHQEKAYLNTEDKEIISFKWAKELREF